MSAGYRLRFERERRALGLREVSRKTGISPAHLSEIEREHKLASEDVLTTLAKLYGLDAWELCLCDGRLPAEAVEWVKAHAIAETARLREAVKRG